MDRIKVKLRDVIAPGFYELHRTLKQEFDGEVWCKGGRGSTKSTFISVQIILGIKRDPQANAIVFRRYQNELRKTVLGQFIWTINKLGLEHEFKVGVSPMTIVYKPTGQQIVFDAADNPDKGKSINLGRGYIKYAWFEEVDQFGGAKDMRKILQSLFRGMGGKRIAFFSYNPPKSARSWVNQEAKVPRADRIVHTSDYTTVPPEWLGERFIADAEHLKETDPDAYRHEYMGEEIGTGLEVFDNVIIREITEDEIQAFSQPRQGLDFGYAVDPAAFLRMNYNRKKKRLHIYREVNGLRLSDEMLYQRIVALDPQFERDRTTADSAEPKSIARLDGLGMNIHKSIKGGDSVNFGIKHLQELERIIIDPIHCPLAAFEFVNYALKVDKAGNVISQYPDKDNHTIDAARYGLEDDAREAGAAMVAVRGG